MAYGDNPGSRTKPKTKKKVRRTRAPSTTDRTSPNPSPPPKPKKGPPSPQRTGRPTRPQPVVRKRDAPPARTDRTSDAKRTPRQKAHDRDVVDRTIRETRRIVLRKRGRNATVKQIKRELEGRGVLAKGLGAVADLTEKKGFIVQTGGPSVGVNLGTSRGKSLKLPKGTATALAPKGVPLKGNVGGKLAKDLINLPAQALPSVYQPAAAVKEGVVDKDWSRGKKLVEDVKQHDPIYNVAAAGVEKAKGNDRAAKSHLRKAEKAVEEHPGFALAEAYGAKGAVGRGSGTVMRSGAVGKKAKRAASTEREARQVPGTNVREERTYSRDVLTKAGQVGVEKARRKSAARLRRRADRAEEGSDRQRELREKAARRDPDRLPEREIQRRVDERVAVNEDIRRTHRTDTVNRARKIVKDADSHVTSVVAQRISRADKDDLRAYVRELETEFPGLSNSGKRANKTLRRELEKAIEDPKLDLGRVEAAARSYEELIAPLERKLVKRGLLAEGQEGKAKLIPYAVRNMGAKHDPKPRAPREMRERHEIAVAAAEAEARNATRARASLRSTKSAAARAQRVKQVDAPKRRVRVRQPGIKAPFEIRLPRRPLTDKERALVDERIAEFRQASREAVRSGKKAVAAQERTASMAATQAKKAKPKKYVPGIVDPNGEPLTVEAIRAHMERHGVEEPAFITQAPNQRGARNFNVRSERPVAIQNGRRTGEATRKGTFDADPETLVEGAARAQGLVDATDGFRKSIKEFAARDESKKVRRFKTYKEAQQAARDLVLDANGDPVPGAVALRPVRLNPFGAKREQLDRLLEDVDSLDQSQAESLVETMREGLTATSGDGPWALIPDAAARRLQDHLNSQGGGGGVKSLQLAQSAFRKTVLSTSPSWMAGNLIEGLFRSGLAKAGPKSYARGRGALKRLEEIDPKAAEEAMHRIVSGGHFKSVDKTHMRRGAEQFEGTKLAPLATALGRLWRTPGPKQVAQFWNRYTDWVFNVVNGQMETTLQTAMLGRALKDSGLKAAEDAAKGLKNTEAQVRFGREVDRMYGRYSKLGPAERKILTTYTPFARWAINSAYFITRTLPRDHPVATAVIAASVNATQEWREQEGLDLFLEEGGLPGFLQGSIPTGGGGHFRVSRFTPFGAAGAPGETAAGQVLPLWQGPLAALKGKDWRGRDLKVGPDGEKRDANELERMMFAARAFAEATVPALGQAQRIAEDGPEALNPFRIVKPSDADKPKKKLKIATPAAKKKVRRSPSGSGSFFGGSSSSSGSSSGGGGFFD